MPFVKSMPDDASAVDVFAAHPAIYRPWVQTINAILRGPSSLSHKEREIIAVYTSGLNECQYCRGGHAFIAESLGVSPETIEDLLGDIDAARVDERLRPILRYIRKLTLTPNRMTQADADAVFDAGWDEKAFHDAIAVCCLFSFMNRLVGGFGILPGPQSDSPEAAEAARTLDYSAMIGNALAARGHG